MSRLWEYLDGELEAEEVLALRCHLGRCASCQPAYACDHAFLALLARCSELKPASTTSREEAIRLKLAPIR